MQFRHVLAAGLSISWTYAIPPESFGFPSAPNDTMLSVSFHSGTQNVEISEAELLGIDVPAQAPTVSVNSNMYRSIADYHGSYFLLMVDPDAMMPQNPTARFYLHWAQPNLTANDQGVLTNSSPAFVPYARPQPPPSSDPHRYILYAFQQPQNLTSIPPAFAGYSDMNRTSFNVTEFISAANLGQPAAANYFFVENKTGVPPEFTASAGGQYPGGNGAAVTDGPGPMPSATGTSGMSASESPSASATGGATSASPTGEAATMGRSVNLALGVVGAVAFWGL